MNDDSDRIDGLDRLVRARPPERDLWPGIAARLAPRRRSRHGLVQLALAASIVAGVAAVFTLSLTGAPVDSGARIAAREPMPLTDDSRAIVEANLSLVRQAGRQLRQALEQSPDHPALRSMLASAENRERALRAML